MVAAGNVRNHAELRKKRRRQFHYNASILLDGKGTLRPCLISDISESGARIVLDSDCELPECFLLLLTTAGDARRRCRVVWRTGKTVGIEFPNANP
jgi:hypothetical protein